MSLPLCHLRLSFSLKFQSDVITVDGRGVISFSLSSSTPSFLSFSLPFLFLKLQSDVIIG